MEKFNTDLTQVLKWMHNKAPQIQSLVNQKYDWYRRYNDQFWSDWFDNVFNLDTVDEFGVYVWCEILGIPKNKFVLEPLENNWAYGEFRKNYIASAGNVNPDRELEGGNFFGAGRDIVTGLDEARWALKLRYVTLTSDGRIENINRMLSYIFNDGQPYDPSSNKFFYVVDDSQNIIGTDLNLKFNVLDWRGNWEPVTYARWQLGYRNTDPYNIQQYLSAKLSWAGTSPANQQAKGFFGGDTSAQPAPDGTTNAAGLVFQSPTVNVPGYGALTVQNILAEANTRNVFSVYLNFSNMPTSLIKYEIKCGDFNRSTTSNLSPANVLEFAVAKFDVVNGQVQNFRLVPFVDPIDGSPYKVNQALAGFQDLGNGWFRFWNGLTTPSSFPSGTTTANCRWTIGTDASLGGQVPMDAGYKLVMFGHMVDYYQSINQRTDNPSVTPFWYNNRAITGTPAIVSQTDLVITNNTPPTLPQVQVAATIGPYTSMLYPSAVFTYTGRYNYWNQTAPVQIAVGDGTTRTYNIPKPPGYIEPYTTPRSMQYRIGSAFTFSSQFIALISNRDNGILPANAGIPYSVVKY